MCGADSGPHIFYWSLLFVLFVLSLDSTWNEAGHLDRVLVTGLDLRFDAIMELTAVNNLAP